MNNIRLRVGPNRLIIDSEEIKAVSVNYSLKDIKNYGKRNTSFTRPISILQTQNTDKIFKALFNVNTSGGFDIKSKVYAELEEGDITILRGNLEVIDILKDSYEVMLSANTNSLLSVLGDKLIYGNENITDDISWAGNPFQHDISIGYIRTMLNADPSNDGTGLIYTVIDYDGRLEYPNTYIWWDKKPQVFQDNYKIYPAVAAKQIFDKIIEDNGYSYTMDSSMAEILKKLYIPYNGDWLDLAEDWKYAKYYFGNPQGLAYTSTTVELTPNWLWNFPAPLSYPKWTVMGYTFADSYLSSPNQVSGGYDQQFKQSSSWDTLENSFVLPHAGTYQIDVSMYCFNTNATVTESIEWIFLSSNYKDGLIEESFRKTKIPAASGDYINYSFQVVVSEKSECCFYKTAESSNYINLIFGPWSYFNITEINAYYTGKTVDLNDLLPRNYKQKDFINDILKMFNSYVTVDESDETRIHIEPYPVFYDTSAYVDWSGKINEDSIKFKSIKNSFAKTTTFGFTDDSDIYTEDYLSKYPVGIYSNQIINDSEFASEETEIKLNSAQGVQITWPGTVGRVSSADASVDPNWEMKVLTINDDSQFKTSWKPRLLFANTYDVSIGFGVDRLYNSGTTLSKLNTLSPRMLKDTADTGNIFLGFNSVNTYVNDNYETNENLYNKYYKEDILENIDDKSYLMTAEFFITPADINKLDFAKRIKITNWKHGVAWYYLNAIKDYTPGVNLTTVELIKDNIVNSSYSSQIGTNQIFKSQLGANETGSSRSTSSGASAGGGTTSDLQNVTETGNITNQGIVFENITSPASQVELNVNLSSELTIDGGLEVNEGVNLTKDLSVGQDIYTDGSIHIAQDAHIEGSMDVDTNVKIGGTLSVTGVTSLYDVNVAGDISIGDTEFVDDTFGHYPFISGFTGTGYQLIRDADDNYRLELDNLLVRGNLTAYELILHKIRALNGSLWVSSAVEAVWPGEASTYIPAGLYYGTDSNGDFTAYFYTDLYNNSLVADDYIRSQQFMGNNIHQLDWIVTDSSGTYIFVKNAPQDRTDGDGPDNGMGMSNIDASTFNVEGGGYDIIWETDGEKVKTNYFTVEGPGMVYVAASWNYDATIEADPLRFRLLDGSNNNIAVPIDVSIGSEILQETFYITDTDFNGDASCYITVENDSDGHVMAVNTFNVDEVKDYTLSYRDVTGFTFVRRGNPTDPDRQGALYLTADDSNAPYIEVLDSMTGHDIASNNRKARLGKLDGLTWRDASISGYGLWSDSIYLTGGINAEAGTIGNFEIEGGKLVGTGTSGDKIILDPDTPSVVLTDASQSIVAEITNQPIISIDDIQSATEIEYAGTYADRYTDVAYQFAQDSYFGGVKYWRPDIYVKNHQTTGNTYLDASTSERATTYDIQVIADSAYTVNMYANIYASYLVPESSEGTWREEPDPPLVDEYIVLERNFYEIAGGWQINANTHFYDGADTSLGTSYKSLYGTYTGNYGRVQVVSNKSITPTDGSIYIKFSPEIKNGFYINNYFDVWEYNNYYDGMGWRWKLLYYVEGALRKMDASVLFSVEIDELGLNGRIQKTQIGQDGILTYWDDTKYFTVNNRESPLIQSAGGWTHNLGSNSIKINSGGETTYSSSPIALACNKQSWMASLQNKRNSNDGWGILLDAGNGTSTPANLIMFRDYNGNQVGLISHNSTNTLYGHSSDRREKGNIRDTSIDALSVINDIQVRNWEWNRTGKTDIGFVAQELVEIVPDAVIQPADPSDMWSVCSANLIPYLVKALQEANARIEQLEIDVSILKSS